MATRFRLTQSTTAPAVSPALQSYSHSAPATLRRQLLTTDSSTLTSTAYTPDAADHLVAGDALWCQFVSDGMLSGKAFNSADVIKWAIQGLEANASNNLAVQCYIAIVDSVGTTVQRVLKAKHSEGTELAAALTNRFLTTTQNGANYTTATGDRLVVEFSVVGTPAAAGGVQGHNATMRFGGAGAGGDLPENDTETGTTFNPWIEFAPSDLFPNPQTATPGVASLTTTAFEPTVTASDHQLVTPTTASLATATFEPTVSVAGGGETVTPTTASLTTATFAPTVTTTNHQTVTPTTASLSTATFAPTVTASDHKSVIPATVALALAGFAPTVTATNHQSVTPPTASLVLTTFVPSVGQPTSVTPNVASLTTTRFAPTVTTTQHQLLTPATANLALTAFAPTVTVPAPQLVTPTTAALVMTAFAPSIGLGGVSVGGHAVSAVYPGHGATSNSNRDGSGSTVRTGGAT